jgi:hypothetical protein
MRMSDRPEWDGVYEAADLSAAKRCIIIRNQARRALQRNQPRMILGLKWAPPGEKPGTASLLGQGSPMGEIVERPGFGAFLGTFVSFDSKELEEWSTNFLLDLGYPKDVQIWT